MSRGVAGLVLGAAAAVLLAGCGSSKTTTTPRSSTATRPAPAAGPTGTAATSIPPSNGAATAILPAQFTLNANGSLSPPSVSGPLDTTILLTVSSHAPHPVTLSVASRSLTVSPGGHAAARLRGLKAGRYPIRVNGIPRGALVVGVQPGP